MERRVAHCHLVTGESLRIAISKSLPAGVAFCHDPGIGRHSLVAGSMRTSVALCNTRRTSSAASRIKRGSCSTLRPCRSTKTESKRPSRLAVIFPGFKGGGGTRTCIESMICLNSASRISSKPGFGFTSQSSAKLRAPTRRHRLQGQSPGVHTACTYDDSLSAEPLRIG